MKIVVKPSAARVINYKVVDVDNEGNLIVEYTARLYWPIYGTCHARQLLPDIITRKTVAVDIAKGEPIFFVDKPFYTIHFKDLIGCHILYQKCSHLIFAKTIKRLDRELLHIARRYFETIKRWPPRLKYIGYTRGGNIVLEDEVSGAAISVPPHLCPHIVQYIVLRDLTSKLLNCAEKQRMITDLAKKYNIKKDINNICVKIRSVKLVDILEDVIRMTTLVMYIDNVSSWPLRRAKIVLTLYAGLLHNHVSVTIRPPDWDNIELPLPLWHTLYRAAKKLARKNETELLEFYVSAGFNLAASVNSYYRQLDIGEARLA